MLRKLVMQLVAVAAALTAAACPVAGDESAVTLANAVKEFNQRAQRDATGRDQPALTEDELIAAIRGWDRGQVPAANEVYNIYQGIADTRTLPARANLTFTTRWVGFNKHDFDVWWVDLTIMTGPNTGYTFRLRDRKLRCRPHE
jgi:hypothetical protein